MASLFDMRGHQDSTPDYARRISTHLAAGLVTFCVLQIIVVAKLGGSLVMHLGIVASIALFALAARQLEHGWRKLLAAQLPVDVLSNRYRADLLVLWGAALVAPFLWIPVNLVSRVLFG